MKRPAEWKIRMAMDFKAGKSVANMTANNLASEREEIEDIIREVMLWQEQRGYD